MSRNKWKQRKRRTANLRFAFIVSIFLILLVTSVILLPVVFWVVRAEPFGPNPFNPLLLLFLLSLLIGTMVTGIVGNRILRPINEISEAMKAVAAGDFSVRLETPQRVNELEGIFQNFNGMVRELDSIETLRNDFVVNVSHEFKTPLASIEGCATLLQDETATPDERREYCEMILGATRQLGTLTGNILKLSKLENSGRPLDKASFRLDEQLRQAVLSLEGEWTAGGLELDVDLDQVEYDGDEELLLQVWLNLLGNAIKFTGPGGRVRLALFKTSAGVSVEVEDSGAGMSEEVQRHAFEKFYQGDAARGAQGNGLGLALAASIVQAHGGSIGLKSEEGKGTVFTVRLPG